MLFRLDSKWSRLFHFRKSDYNGVAYTYSFTSESVRGGNITTIPFKKGDLIYSPNFRFVVVCKVAYYKLRDYTGR